MSHPQYEPQSGAAVYNDMTVGDILRKTREHYGQSLPYVESVLRIRASQLEALETGNLDVLPGRVYAIGFVRSYSEYLGLDGDQMVRLFKEQTKTTARNPELHFPVAASDHKLPGLGTIIASLLGLVILVGLWIIFQEARRPSRDIPPVPEDLKTSSISEAPAIVSSPDDAQLLDPKPEVGAVVERPENRIIIEVTANSWIEILRPDGSTIVRRVLEEGDKYLVPNEDGLTLSTGNAGGFQLRIDGEYLLRLGEDGDVMRNITLDPEALLKR